MKMIIALVLMVPMFANAGSISCIIDDGNVITALLDGEANIENFKILDVASNKNTDLLVDSIDLTNNKMNIRFRTVIDGESIFYVIKVDALNTFSKASYREDSSASDFQSARCLVNFKAGI